MKPHERTRSPGAARPRRSSPLQPLEQRVLLSSTYYVSPSGDDTLAGTSDATAFATLQHAADLVQAGDTVVVRAGTYAAGFALGYNAPQAGTASAPISFLADPGVVITGKAPHTSSGFTSAVDISNGSDYVTVQGFNIIDTAATLSGAGIWVTDSAHVSLLGNTCTATAKWGILTGSCNYLDVEHNTLSGVGQHGIYIGNACTSPIVKYNTSFSNGRSGIQFNGDKAGNPATTGIIDHATVEFNVCYDNALTSSAAAISLDGVQDSLIGDNLLYDNHGNGIVLFPADGGTLNGGVDPASINNLIVDNTVANSRYWAIQVIDGSMGNTLLDNILWTDAAFSSYGSIECDTSSLSRFHSDYNVVVGTNPANGTFGGDANDGTPLSLAQWQARIGQDTHSVAVTSGAALFASYAGPTASNNDYHLTAGSPAVDAGAASLAGQNALPSDLNGNLRPQGAGYDVGAYELPQATIAPAAPSNLAATPADPLAIQLSWTANSNNAASILIERSTDGTDFAPLASVPGNVTSYLDPNLTTGITYTYRLRANNWAGTSDYSNTASAVGPAVPATPSTPTGLAATAPAYGQIALNWAEPSSKVTSFLVERSSNGVNFTQIASSTAPSYTDTGLMPATLYYYRVRASNAGTNSGYSNVATATTQPVGSGPYSLFSSSVVPATVDDADTTANELGVRFESDVAGVVSGISFYKGATNTGIHTGHLWTADGQLLASVTFTNEAASGWQQASFSQPVSIQPNTTYVASYFAPNGGYAEDDYYFYFANGGVSGGPLHAPQAGVVGYNGVFARANAPAFPNQTYLSANYYVTPVFVPATAFTVAPTAPANLTATPADPFSIALAWTDTSDNATSFLIERSTDGTNFMPVATVGPSATSYSDGGMQSGMTYYYRVCAANGAGVSPFSGIASAVGPAAPTVPAAPSNLAAATAGYGRINLTWTNNAANQTGLLLERSTDGANFTGEIALPATATSYGDIGLAPGTTYFYQIIATNWAGESPASNLASASTQAANAAPYDLFAPSVVPQTVDAADTTPNELGVQFRSDIAGTVTGIRFYKGPTNTGTHIGHLWAANGQLLASVTFAAETDSGWQEADFSQPVAIQPNTIYIASYFAPNGGYAYDPFYFAAAGVDNGPLHAPKLGPVGRNGLFVANSSPAFPTQDAGAVNYYVDLVFAPSGGPGGTAPAAPSNLSAKAAAGPQIDLAWSAPPGNQAGFVLERSIDDVNFTAEMALPPDAVSCVDTAVVPGTTYYYRLATTNSAGLSTYSNVASATASATMTQQPVTLTLAGSGPEPSNSSQPLRFTATVTGGVPDGETLALVDASNDNTVVAIGTLGGGSATLTIAAGTLRAGTHELLAVYGGDADFAPSQSAEYAQTVQVAVTAVVINGDDPNGLYTAPGQSSLGLQRSMVEDIVYMFSEPVVINDANAAFTVQVAGSIGVAPATLIATAVPGTNGTQWAVSLTGQPVGVLASIANGEYRISINPAFVFAAIDGTTALSAGRTDTFYRLYADINGDRIVNNADNLQFRRAQATYNPALDSNADGFINNADNLQLRRDQAINFFSDGFVTSI